MNNPTMDQSPRELRDPPAELARRISTMNNPTMDQSPRELRDPSAELAASRARWDAELEAREAFEEARRVEQAVTTALPTDSMARKGLPLAKGFLDYFPAAIAEVARLSKHGNDKHNPGEELHWSRGKSNDHADCIMRHLIERGQQDDDSFSHTVKVAWRAMALLQEECEARGAPLARGARETPREVEVLVPVPIDRIVEGLENYTPETSAVVEGSTL